MIPREQSERKVCCLNMDIAIRRSICYLGDTDYQNNASEIKTIQFLFLYLLTPDIRSRIFGLLNILSRIYQ